MTPFSPTNQPPVLSRSELAQIRRRNLLRATGEATLSPSQTIADIDILLNELDRVLACAAEARQALQAILHDLPPGNGTSGDPVQAVEQTESIAAIFLAHGALRRAMYTADYHLNAIEHGYHQFSPTEDEEARCD